MKALATPDGKGSVLANGKGHAGTEGETCCCNPCYYKLVPCPEIFSEALLLVPCGLVPEGKTSLIYGGICYVLDEQVDHIPEGYTVVTGALIWSIDCPDCFDNHVDADDCAALCGRCPTTKAVVVDITVTSGDEVRHYYGTANVTAPSDFDLACFNYNFVGSSWLWLDYDDPAATDDDPGESFHGYLLNQRCYLSCNRGTSTFPGVPACDIPGYYEVGVLLNTFHLPCPVGKCICCPHGSVTSFPGLTGWSGSITV